MKNFTWRLVVAALVLMAAIVYVLPTIDMALNDKKEPTLWPYKKINRGLDLQGGMHLVLEVQTEEAVNSTIERITTEIRGTMKAQRIRFMALDQVEQNKIVVKVKGPKNIEGFNKILSDDYQNLRILSRQQIDDVLEIRMDLPDKEAERIMKSATDQALETIRNRIDQFGVNEPGIRKQGDKRIIIQLPGVEDPERAKKLLGKTALLEFKLVDESRDPSNIKKKDIPRGSQLLYQIRKNRETNQESKTPFLIKKRALLTGAYLTDARVQIDSQYNEPYVSIKFDKKGAKIFSRVTEQNVQKRLAIVLDNTVYSAPTIQEKIPGGEARITGRFSMEEARDLAIILRAGALPAPVKILEERTVGASLGVDSINKGLFSMYIAGILVVIFMVIYYRASGLVADMALILNILLIAGGLAAFQATLTLPGIAGVILTIGMAVDANVLIFERIREEMALGKTPHASVNAGYERATLTILDANVTTLIAAIVLFQFGTGPVKGFAVTLSLGVIASLFTALFLTRLAFDYFLVKRKIKTLSI